MTTQYVRFNAKDEILGTHKAWCKALSKSNNTFEETYINISDYNLSSLCELRDIKKGAVINGLWGLIDEVRTHKLCNELMVKYLCKEFVDSDETPAELDKKGLQNIKSLISTLSLYKINFDEWIKNYTDSGQALKDSLDTEALATAEKDALLKADLGKATEKFAGACFSLPAIAGKMGSSIYYTVQIPFAQVPQLFKFNQNEIPVELRAQRQLNTKRASAIADYMEDRKYDYTLPALTASVSESMRFEPVDGFSNLGMVQIPIGATMLINDGQHRASSIETILERHYHQFKDQSISVVLFYDQGLERSQQMFADINDKMVKPPKALNILFDRTNKMNSLVVESIELAGMTQAVEFEKASPGAKSSKVWSISALKKAIETVTGLNDKKAKALSDEEIHYYKKLIVNWLTALVEYTKGDLKEAVFNGSSAMLTDMRLNLVNTHAVYLHAVALASVSMVDEFKSFLLNIVMSHELMDIPVPTFDDLKILSGITVQKTADLWRERLVNTDGTMNPTANGIKLGAHVILENLGAFVPTPIIEVNTMVFGDVA
ncbi:MAG: DGQHR domain-containing protein [Gammaproteobacteria bacterium]|nr:DGQHR domain-containing protein [Gammaproteobacteria bacterium]